MTQVDWITPLSSPGYEEHALFLHLALAKWSVTDGSCHQREAAQPARETLTLRSR